MYLAVSEENSRKNTAYGLAQVVNRTKVGDSFAFSFDVARVLRISIAGLTAPERTAIQNACDIRFGPGKVVVS